MSVNFQDDPFKDMVIPEAIQANVDAYHQLISRRFPLIGVSVLSDVIPELQEALRILGNPNDENRLIWLALRYWLGAALIQVPSGNREMNIEQAIRYLDEGLQECIRLNTDNAYHLPHGLLLKTLAVAHDQRVSGYFVVNKDKAISLYQEAQRFYSPEQHPHDWAEIAVNLASALFDRARAPSSSATALQDLGMMYLQRAADLVHDNDPELWSRVQERRANCYLNYLSGIKSDNIEHAIECCNQSLDAAIPTRAELADMYQTLGQCYAIRQAGDKDFNYHRAQTYFAKAIEWFSKERYPAEYLYLQVMMGTLEGDHENWEDAHAAFLEVQEVESFLLQTTDDPIQKDHIVKDSFEVALNDGYALTCLHRIDEAIITIERSRARFLIEARDNDFSNQTANDTSFTLQTLIDIAATVQEHHALVYVAATHWGGMALFVNGRGQVQHLSLPVLTTEFMNSLVETFLPDGSQRLIGGYAHAYYGIPLAALLPWLVWGETTIEERVHHLQELVELSGINSTLAESATQTLQYSQLDIKQAPYGFMERELDRCLPLVEEHLMSPLLQWLKSYEVMSVSMIACGLLAAFPLAAMQIIDLKADENAIPMSFIPNARSLVRVDRATKGKEIATFTLPDDSSANDATDNPSGFSWFEAESNSVAAYAKQSRFIGQVAQYAQQRATKKHFFDSLLKAYVLHIAGHSNFLSHDILRSAIRFNDGLLTLKEILLPSSATLMQSLDASNVRLLILASCETNVQDINVARDEVRSFAAGFIQARVQAVLATMWKVSSLASFLLIYKFCQEWFPYMDTRAPTEALIKAQQYVKTITRDDLKTWRATVHRSSKAWWSNFGLTNTLPMLKSTEEMVREAAKTPQHRDIPDGTTPFAHPYYWAGFHIVGW